MTDLPAEIPVFPLPGVLLLPGGQLPLNVFEPRYLAMVDDALRGARLIGMIQPRDAEPAREAGSPSLFSIGCAGRISAFEETGDGRMLITLTGVSRFQVARELEERRGYRVIRADWGRFEKDARLESCLDLDRARLKQLLGAYFSIQGISCDWEAIDGAPDQKLITCLSMICPFDSGEKQALLEATCCRTRAGMFMTMLEMAVRDKDACGGGCH